MEPLVSPEKDPVSCAPTVAVKLGLKRIALAETVTLPAILAFPVIGVATAGNAKLKKNNAGA